MKRSDVVFLAGCLCAALFFLVLAVQLPAQDIQSSLALTIREELDALRLESVLLSEELKGALNEAKESRTESIELYSSLTSMNERSNRLVENLIRTEEKLALAIKVVIALGIFAAVVIVGRCIGICLYLKKVPVPRIVDILL